MAQNKWPENYKPQIDIDPEWEMDYELDKVSVSEITDGSHFSYSHQQIAVILT